MLRILVILAGCLIAVSAYQAQPDVLAALAEVRQSQLVTRVEEFIASWQFMGGLAVGLASGEVLRIVWRYTMMATEFVTVIGGRMVQYAAIASLVGIVIYFI